MSAKLEFLRIVSIWGFVRAFTGFRHESDKEMKGFRVRASLQEIWRCEWRDFKGFEAQFWSKSEAKAGKFSGNFELLGIFRNRRET